MAFLSQHQEEAECRKQQPIEYKTKFQIKFKH